MNDLKGIIEDCNKSDLVSDKIIKKIIEIIGQEEWQDLHDENNDICTTMGELIITLNGIADLEKENAELKESFFVVRCVRSGCPYLHLETRNCLKVGGFFTAVSNKHCPMMQNLNSSIQLTKATEIIKKLKALYFSPVVTKDDVKRQDEILAEVEQFLNSEIEK